MPKEKIIKEQVSHIKEESLQPQEIQKIKSKAYKQIMLYLPGYLLLLAGAYIIYINAPESYKVVVNRRAQFDEEETSRMWKLAPYVSLFVVIMSTIFFGKIYYQSILPLLKDLKQRTKLLVFYKPQKIPMAVFNRFYLSVPIFPMRQIQVDNNDFTIVSETEDICLQLSKNSLLLLGIKKDDKEIKFFEPLSRS